MARRLQYLQAAIRIARRDNPKTKQSAVRLMNAWTMKTWTAVAVALVIGVAGCGRSDTITPADVAEGEVPATQPVTVRGELEKKLDERSFTMSGTAEIFSDDLVVVSRTDLPVINVGDEIEVSGTVRRVNHIEIERETSWTFNPQITVELADVKGYLVADSVRIVERQ
jgi:hypothetical protein